MLSVLVGGGGGGTPQTIIIIISNSYKLFFRPLTISDVGGGCLRMTALWALAVKRWGERTLTQVALLPKQVYIILFSECLCVCNMREGVK